LQSLHIPYIHTTTIAPAIGSSKSNSSANSANANAGSGVPRSGIQLLEMLEREMEGDESSLIDLNKYSERLTAEYNEKVEFQVCALQHRLSYQMLA
jgi:hypothetical protein